MDKIMTRLKLLLPDSFLAVLLASGISMALISSILEKTSYVSVLYYTIAIMFVSVLLFWNIFTFMGAISVSSATMVIFIAFFDKKHMVSGLLYYIAQSFYRVFDFIVDEGNIEGLEKLITIFICSVVTILVYFIVVRFRAYKSAIIAGGIVFVVQTVLGFFASNTSLYVYVISIALIYFNDTKKTMMKEFSFSGTSQSKFLASMVPLALVIFVSSVLMPYSSEPIQWPWMDNKINHIYSSMVNSFDTFTGKNDFFSLNSSGFGEKVGGKLGRGSSITTDNTEVLKVFGPKPVYLKARGMDVYSDNEWKNSYTEQKDLLDKNGFVADELYEVNFGMKILSNGNTRYADLFKVYKYDISFVNLNIKSIFIPKGLAAIDYKNYRAKADYNITTSMDSRKKKGFQYELIAQLPRYESPAFQDALRNSYDGLYSSYMRSKPALSWQWADRELIPDADSFTSADKELKIADFAKKAEEIRTNYTKLPNNLPKRIQELTLKITEGQNTKYDKAKAIEKYLKDNYTYTLTPGDTPKGRDFVDYFLFEQKQGYCSYYATAMAVMARTIGIPSRYVEGYKMPATQNDDGSYTITNKEGHAWVEIYFEGAGWVQFEPTAPFNDDFYKQEVIISTSSEDLSFEDESTPEPEDVLPEDEVADTGASQNNNSKLIKVLIIIAAVLAIIAVGILITVTVNIERRRHRIRKYKSLSPNMAMVKLYEELLGLLKKLGYGIADNETALQYGKRIDGLFYISPVSFGKISEDFTEARYSSRQIEGIKLESYDKAYLRILEIYKKEKGKVRYLIEHYLLGII